MFFENNIQLNDFVKFILVTKCLCMHAYIDNNFFGKRICYLTTKKYKFIRNVKFIKHDAMERRYKPKIATLHYAVFQFKGTIIT